MLLEIKCPVKGTVGSNPTLSAIEFKASSVLLEAFFIAETQLLATGLATKEPQIIF